MKVNTREVLQDLLLLQADLMCLQTKSLVSGSKTNLYTSVSYQLCEILQLCTYVRSDLIIGFFITCLCGQRWAFAAAAVVCEATTERNLCRCRWGPETLFFLYLIFFYFHLIRDLFYECSFDLEPSLSFC